MQSTQSSIFHEVAGYIFVNGVVSFGKLQKQ